MQEVFQHGIMKLQKAPGEHNPADILTKSIKADLI